MKRLLVWVAMMAVGCTAAKRQEEKPLPPGYVELARFSAEVDPAAGTFVVRTTPTAAGQGLGLGQGALVFDSTVVDVANKSPGDVHIPDGTALCPSDPDYVLDGGLTWSAIVTLTSKITDTTVLSGVYARITEVAGVGTGWGPCNNAPAPDGMDSTYGLWSYGVLQPGDSHDRLWRIKYTSHAGFIFRGVIVGSAVHNFAYTPAPGTLIADYGALGVVYASGNHVYYVDPDGTSRASADIVYPPTRPPTDPPQTPTVTVLVTDPVNQRVWWATADGLIGYLENDGADLGVSFDYAGEASVDAIVVDPADPTLAWFTATDLLGFHLFGHWLQAVSSSSPGLFGPEKELSGAGISLAAGPDDFLYVGEPDVTMIEVFDTDTSSDLRFDQWNIAAPAACSHVNSLLADPGGATKMWYSGDAGVCTIDVSSGVGRGTRTEIVPADPLDPLAAARPERLCLGPDDEVWYVDYDASEAVRVTDTTEILWETTRSYSVVLLDSPRSCARGGGFLWAPASFSGGFGGLIRIDPCTPGPGPAELDAPAVLPGIAPHL